MVKNDIEWALDDNNAVFLVMLDLSAAFDTTDYDILMALISKVQPSIGFHWYITGRHFRISVSGIMSEEFILECGVPQVSVIDPRVFSMNSHYVSSIICCHGLNYHIYADDMQIYMPFNPNVPGDVACAIFKITLCVEEVHVWLMKNMLKLNDSKTKFFTAASSHNMNRLSKYQLSDWFRSDNSITDY